MYALLGVNGETISRAFVETKLKLVGKPESWWLDNKREGNVIGGKSRVVSGDRWCRSDTFLFKGIVVVRLQAAAGGTLAMWEKRRWR